MSTTTRRVDLSFLAHRGTQPLPHDDEIGSYYPYGTVIRSPDTGEQYVLACVGGEPRWVQVVGRGRPIRSWYARLTRWWRKG